MTLCRHIEDIERHWKLGTSDAEMETFVREFRSAAMRHFEDEISVLTELGAATDQHCRAHMTMIEEIDTALRETLRQGERNRWFALVDALERMLYDHEILEDSRYYGLLAGPASA